LGKGVTSTEFAPTVDYYDTSSQQIKLIVTNPYNCVDSMMVSTGPLYNDFHFNFPSAFSPDGNGINDLLKPISTPYTKEYTMEVYNRWGELIYKTNDINQGWNGTYLGKECPQDVYICRIFIIPIKGSLRHFEVNVTLLR
jgi:gliding motility-associated-like protein